MNHRIHLDALAVVSCVGVVALHCNGVFWDRPHGFTWWSANAIECLFYFAAPIFFMISGATLMDYRTRYDTRTFLLKRFRRTVIPFLFWSVVAFVVASCIWGFDPRSLLSLPYDILTCRYMRIYWFFLPLFTWYLSLPLFSLLAGRRRLVGFLILLGFVFTSVYPFVCTLAGEPADENLLLPALGGMTVLMLLGYYLDAFEVPGWFRRALYGLGVLGVAIHFVGTDLLSGETVSKVFKGYTTPLCLAHSSAVFLFFRRHAGRLAPFAPLLDALKRETFGVYLLHGFIVFHILPFLFSPAVRASLGFRLIATVAVTVLCAAVSRIFRIFRLTRWMV